MRLNRVMLWVCISPVLCWGDAAQDLKTKLDKIEDLSGKFEQQLKDKKGQSIQATQGDFSIKRPGYFLWQSGEPYPQVVVGTPEKIWVYDPDLEQVNVRKNSDQTLNNPARLISGDLQDVRTSYDVKQVSEINKETYVLTPKASGSAYKTIRLQFSEQLLTGLEFQDKLEQSTSITFKNLKLNTQIPVNVFVFEPPEGTDVVTDE